MVRRTSAIVVMSLLDQRDRLSRSVRMPCCTASARSSSWVAFAPRARLISSRDRQHLVDADAVEVAGAGRRSCSPRRARTSSFGGPPRAVVEARAPRAVGSYVVAAVAADPAHEPLGDHAETTTREERLDAHVEQAVQRRHGVGRVQRREHEVAGERRLHRDPRGLDVADLADEDHVGVLAQDRLEPAGEGDARPAR